MTDPDAKRGHYFFSLTQGQRFGCGLGKLKLPKGEKWGEVKCFGGAIILGPTDPHPKESRDTPGPVRRVDIRRRFPMRSPKSSEFVPHRMPKPIDC